MFKTFVDKNSLRTPLSGEASRSESSPQYFESGVISDEVSANLNLHTMKTDYWYELEHLGIAVFLSNSKKFIFIDKLSTLEMKCEK